MDRPAPNSEIVVFAGQTDAIHAGFTPGGLHPKLKGVTAWWPSKGHSAIGQMRYKRVTVAKSARNLVEWTDRAAMAEGLSLLRNGGGVFGDAFVWMEL